MVLFLFTVYSFLGIFFASLFWVGFFRNLCIFKTFGSWVGLLLFLAALDLGAARLVQNPGVNQPPPSPGLQPGPALNQFGQLPSPVTAANSPGPSVFVPAPSTFGLNRGRYCLPVTPYEGQVELQESEEFRSYYAGLSSSQFLAQSICTQNSVEGSPVPHLESEEPSR